MPCALIRSGCRLVPRHGFSLSLKSMSSCPSELAAGEHIFRDSGVKLITLDTPPRVAIFSIVSTQPGTGENKSRERGLRNQLSRAELVLGEARRFPLRLAGQMDGMFFFLTRNKALHQRLQSSLCGETST
jgi:hypothetical protein